MHAKLESRMTTKDIMVCTGFRERGREGGGSEGENRSIDTTTCRLACSRSPNKSLSLKLKQTTVTMSV